MMEFVSWDDDCSQLNGKIKFMFQTTNQYIYIYIILYILHMYTHMYIVHVYIVYDYICLCAWHMYWIKLPVSLITFCFITCASSWVAHDSDLDVPWPWRRNQVYTKHESMGKCGKLEIYVQYFGFNFGLDILDCPLCSISDFGLPLYVQTTILDCPLCSIKSIRLPWNPKSTSWPDLSQIANKLLCLQLVVYSPTTMTKD